MEAAKQQELKNAISYRPNRNYDKYLIQIKDNVIALAILFEQMNKVKVSQVRLFYTTNLSNCKISFNIFIF